MKELEEEAEKYARRFEENEQSGYNGKSISIEDRIEIEAFIAGATSKYVEKQKLQFAIHILRELKLEITDIGDFERNENKIKELEQKLNAL